MEDNKEWLEAAQETFDMAVEAGDYETCKLLVADMFDKGFTKESLVLEQLLLAVPLETFIHKTDVRLWK